MHTDLWGPLPSSVYYYTVIVVVVCYYYCYYYHHYFDDIIFAYTSLSLARSPTYCNTLAYTCQLNWSVSWSSHVRPTGNIITMPHQYSWSPTCWISIGIILMVVSFPNHWIWGCLLCCFLSIIPTYSAMFTTELKIINLEINLQKE